MTNFVLRRRRCAFVVTLCLLAMRPALAAQESPAPGAVAPQNEEVVPTDEGTLSSQIPILARARKTLVEAGITPQVTYAGEVLGSVSGGLKRLAIYQGLLDVAVDADLEKIAGIPSLTLHAEMLQIHGRGLSEDIGSLSPLSGIEARASTRLYELYFEKKLFGDKLSIKVGNLAEESDFFISDFGAVYVNGSFGWPNVWDRDLPSGGASYPIATPGLRVKYDVSGSTSLLAGIYDGDPAGVGFSDEPEVADPTNTNFRIKDPPLLMTEAQYRYNQEKDSPGLAGTIRLGGWAHFGRFNNYDLYAFDVTPPAQRLRGDGALYGIIDQMIYRKPGDDPKKGIGGWLRLAGAPADRNYVDFYADGGINLMGMTPGRPDDVAGFGFGIAKITSAAAAADVLAASAIGPMPVRTAEIDLEATYQFQVVPGFVLQPDIQYVIRPGGGVLDPSTLASAIRNALVIGLRANFKL